MLSALAALATLAAARSCGDYCQWAKPDEPELMVPSVLGVACKKCGTTSLHYYLSHLPGFQKPVQMFPGKETKFFAMKPLLPETPAPYKILAKSYRDFLRFWPPLTTRCNESTLRCTVNKDAPRRFAFEVNPGNMVRRYVPLRIRAVLPHWQSVLITMVLRNPGTRAFSAFLHNSLSSRAAAPAFPICLEAGAKVLLSCYAPCKLDYNATGLRPTRKECTLVGNPLSQSRRMRDCLEDHFDPQQYMKNPREVWDMGYWGPEAEEPVHWLARGTNASSCAMAGYNILLAGLYADQIKNYLCVGFRPERMAIFTSTQLRADPATVLKTISVHAGAGGKMPEKMPDYQMEGKSGLIPEEDKKEAMRQASETIARVYRKPNEELLRMARNIPFIVDADALAKELELS
eukprot:TRINITY_DN6206_c0_g2_i1.p1 TRINITY_DN6206_c0_g2~~TRINITY_DN6206_c0_g2_i1.p1  ORF type:complete len:410 (+),score=47.15 TRINITY_DN6206_c0_g2_i1:23-1231(+)